MTQRTRTGFLSRQITGRIIAVLMIVLMSFSIVSVPYVALADPVCTSDSPFDELPKNGNGIVTTVAKEIKGIVDGGRKKLFDAISGNSAFIDAARAAATLAVAIYGIAMVSGIVNVALADAIVRVVKIAIVFALITEGWGFFYTYVGSFFTEGTDELINVMLRASLGGLTDIPENSDPLFVLDRALALVFTPKMMKALLATPLSGPYGFTFGLLLIWGLFSFVRTILYALWIYLMSMVAKMLLFGLAPMFFVFLMFSRTKHLFDGWISQLISYSLQPIMMFAFLGFYMTLLYEGLKEILSVDLCWSTLTQVLGLPFETYFWRFTNGGQPNDSNLGPTDPFPIDIVGLLIFILLAHVAWRYATEVVHIAREISGSAASLPNMGGTLQKWFGDVRTRQPEAARTGTDAKPIFSGSSMLERLRNPFSRKGPGE